MIHKPTLPPCYGEDDCSTAMMRLCTFVDTCGDNLPEQEAIGSALIYWRRKSDEYLHQLEMLDRKIKSLNKEKQ